MVSEAVGKVLLEELPVDVTMEPLTVVHAGLKRISLSSASDSESQPSLPSSKRRAARVDEQEILMRLEREGEKNRAAIMDSTNAILNVLKEFLNKNN